MAEGTYEYECNRAELLGIDPPNQVEWEASENARKEKELAEQMTEIDIQDELLNDSRGKMDEINNILSITQMRLNKFKKACGSLTNLLKIRGANEADQCDSELNATDVAGASEQGQSNDEVDTSNLQNANIKKTSTDIQQKMSSQINKLDSLLTKTEHAQNSMDHQNKQIKSFLKK